jgi:hypothetical protein
VLEVLCVNGDDSSQKPSMEFKTQGKLEGLVTGRVLWVEMEGSKDLMFYPDPPEIILVDDTAEKG